MRKLLLLFIPVIVLSGCWDHNELPDVFLVTGMGIDKGVHSKYKLTVENLVASELNPKTSGKVAPSIVYSEEGDSIAELSRKMNIGVSRKLEFSHMRLVAISSEIAKSGLLEFYDFMERNREIRDNFSIVVVKNAAASDLLKITNASQKYSTGKIHKQLETMVKEWGGDPDVRLKDIVNALLSPGREPIAVAVRIAGDPEKGKTMDNAKLTQPFSNIEISGLAISEDFFLKGYLDLDDTRNYMWTQNKIRSTTINVSCDKDKVATFIISNSNSSIKAWYEDHTPHIKILIGGDASLETIQCKDNLTQFDVQDKYEKLVSKTVKEQVKGTITKAQQKYKLDIFGFGDSMYQQDHKHFDVVKNDWNEEFSKAVVDVNVNLKLRRNGLKVDSVFRKLNKD
ncbi:Ger(x)C family spore germination protein [Paenibacillus sp. GCM10027628]|uniref:Ger(x)C family spore germination protein n=1 Tax=Paenibacillus sp. GCM10027628 TaxID=3273413 RepID=UPI00363A76F8